jgi:hypothetical protein
MIIMGRGKFGANVGSSTCDAYGTGIRDLATLYAVKQVPGLRISEMIEERLYGVFDRR